MQPLPEKPFLIIAASHDLWPVDWIHFWGFFGRRCCLCAGLAIAPCAPVIFTTAMFIGTVTVTEIGAVCMAIAGVGGAVAGAIASGDCAGVEEKKED